MINQRNNINGSCEKEYILIDCMADFSEINGVDVSDLGVIQLSQSAFSSVDYNLYTPFRAHFLIYAVQHQQRLPSEASMMRCERRNQRKCVKGDDSAIVCDRADRSVRVLGRVRRQRQRVIVNRRRRFFIVPSKYGSQPIKRVARNRGRSDRIPFLSSQISLNFPIIGAQNGVIPQMPNFPPRLPPSNLPEQLATIKQIVRKNRTTQKRYKQQNNAFKIKSPENILLKCARTKCRQNFEVWRKEKQLNSVQNVAVQLDERPIYFQKKKANQKRRRLQKHQLIKKNRKALLKIFGMAIFSSGWPVSRKQIKQALGIKEVDVTNSSQCFQGLADLVQGEIMEQAQTQQQVGLMIPQSLEKKSSDRIQNITMAKEDQAIEAENIVVIVTSM